MLPIEYVTDEKLHEWDDELERKGCFRLPDIPFNYYEIKAELWRREQEKEA